MSQFLFVLKEGHVAFWRYSRGYLAGATLNGNRWNEFSPDYWDEWREVNQSGDAVDAILLSDKPNGFDPLPNWLQKHSDVSAWTVAVLSKLVNDDEFKGKGLVLSQGETKFTLAEGDRVEIYSLISSFDFTLSKGEIKNGVVKSEPVKPVSSGIIGDSYNDPEALKLSVGDELKGVIVSIFKTMKRNYVKVEGLKEQVCFKSTDKANFAIGDAVLLTVTKVDEEARKVLFGVRY